MKPVSETAVGQRLTLGGLVLDRLARELRTPDDRPVPLRRQALEVLLTLADQAGHVVDKKALMQRVWPEVVVGDDSLTQAVVEIRRVLGDRQHELLRTVARRGFVLMPTEPAPPAAAPSLSIALLPIASHAAEDEAVASALSAALAARVGMGTAGSKVIAGEAARAVSASTTDPRAIARDLGVQQVASGDLRRADRAWCVSLALVDGESGVRLWAREFTLEDPMVTERLNEFAAQAARAVLVQMHHTAAVRAARKPASERSADELALQGWSTIYQGSSPRNIEQALGFFGQALAKDPLILRGLAGWASGNLNLLELGWAPDPAATRARALDAVARLERAHPDDTLTWCARCFLSGMEGRAETALAIADKMVERAPANPTAHCLRANNLLRLGRFDDSIVAVQRAFALSADDFRAGMWHEYEATAQLMSGRPELAAAAARQAVAANGCLLLAPLLLVAALVALGREAEGRALLAERLASDPGCTGSRVVALLDGTDPGYLEGRECILSSLRAIGLP